MKQIAENKKQQNSGHKGKSAVIRLGKWFIGAIVLLPLLYIYLHTPKPQVVGKMAQRIIIQHVRIVDVKTGALLPKQHLLIENGFIRQISDELINTQANDLVIDATGKYLMPGLIDMHTHVMDREDLLLALSHGVTHSRNMHGMKLHLALREEIKSGQTIGPDLTVASMAFNQLSDMGAAFMEEVITSPEHAREMVNYYHAEGYDLIKLYHGIQLDVFNAIADECRKLGLPFAGHPSFFTDIDTYLASGAQTLEHTEMLFQAPLHYSDNQEALTALIEKLRAKQMPIDATIANFDQLAQVAKHKRPYLDSIPTEYMNPLLYRLNTPGVNGVLGIDAADEWITKSHYLGEITKALYDADIPVVLGSDAGAGYTLNGIGLIEEMQLLSEHNIETSKILHSGTVAGAKALGLQHVIGHVAVGMKANLLLSKHDPRKNLKTFYDLQGVIKNAIYYNHEAIVEMKRKAKGHMGYFELLGWFILGS